ncbi:heavy metal translocating P-type ATPase [Gemella morbillorum]|uniref:heavy metal translocating P-type ATPase n=1 Tax=Gemella morbillorum TaxID=29391 RepID=UPI00248F2076|nr:heavy metal translocating P-type ATPase [Gemella morbillorum]
MCNNIKGVDNIHNNEKKCNHAHKYNSNNISSHAHKHNPNHNHKHNNCHEHNHNHCHTHSHGGKFPVLMYFTGLFSFIVGYLLENSYPMYSNILFIVTVGIAGYHVIFEGLGNTIQNTKKEKRFSPNVHLLMTLAAIGAIFIGNYEEAAMLIVIFAGAHFLEEYVDEKSRKEITNLLNLNPTQARLVLEDNNTKTISIDKVEVGDKLQVLNGDQVPTDGIILSGTTFIDESSITGESVPKEKTIGDEVFGSTINGEGTFIMQVTKEPSDTVFAKILGLVSASQNSLTKTATLLQRLEPKYVTLVLVLFPVVLLVSRFIFGWSWEISLYRSMVYLIAVSPCALAASAIPTTLATISNLSKRGVLVKGGAYLSHLSNIKAIAFDKTGTLTNGEPVVTDYVFEENESELIRVVVSMEKQSNHPLARAIVNKFPNVEPIELEVENKIGVGLVASYLGDEYSIAKVSVFSDVSAALNKQVKYLAKEGKTIVFVAKNSNVVGLLAFMDIPNSSAKPAVEYFKKQGIYTMMITGDSYLTGEAVGKIVGVDEVRANIMPEDKAQIIKSQKGKYGSVAMLGDGVNDAPALTLADIGVAMGNGTDIAMGVADLILMKNDLSKLRYAHKLSKKMLSITYQNIIFAMFVVVALVILNFLGKMDITFGVILHEGSTLAVILNSLRMLKEVKE